MQLKQTSFWFNCVTTVAAMLMYNILAPLSEHVFLITTAEMKA